MSIDPQKLSELWAKGLNAAQIATRMGATVSGVHQALKRLGVADAGKRTGSKISCSARNV